jgi:poly(A) polymerase
MTLSRERIADELLKLLSLADPSPTITLMHARGLFAPVIPEIATTERLAGLIASEQAAAIAPNPVRRLAALLPPDPATADRVAARLKFSNKAKKRLASAADPDLGLNPRALAYRIGSAEAGDRLLLAGEADAAAALKEWPVPRLPVGGAQMMARGIDQGPRIAKTLRAIEDRWVAEGFPEGTAFDAIVDAAVASAQ